MKRKNWLIMTLLGLSGFIAWEVENSWFNTFVYDEITPNPEPIALMVAVSAVTATLTTLFIGTWSDRIGRRKPFILAGYILWALSTIAFPFSSMAGSVQMAVVLVVLLDAVMTFFGSTANDAAFHAWVTDNTDSSNRGRVEALLNILPIIAIIIAMGLSGLIIERFGYTPFFLALGGLVFIMGLAGAVIMKEDDSLKPVDREERSFWNELLQVFSPSVIRKNLNLYLVFFAMGLFGISTQIVTPYELIYLNNYLVISKTVTGIVVALIAPVIIVFAIPIGYLTDRKKGFPTAIAGFILGSAGQFLFSLVENIAFIGLFGVLKSVGFLMSIVLGAWARNFTPEDARGQFQGVRLIFLVMLPMVIGPAIGSRLIAAFGTESVVNGIEGLVPTPIIYQISAMAGLLPLVPLFLLRRRNRGMPL